MEKRVILAIALIFLVLFFSPLLFKSKKPAPTLPPQGSQKAVYEEPLTDSIRGRGKPPEPELLPQVSEETIITVQMPLYEVQLTTEGARAVSWKLKDYLKRTKETGEAPEYIDLIPLTAGKCLTIQFHDPGIQSEVETARWTSSESFKAYGGFSPSESSQNSIEFGYAMSTGVNISKKMTFLTDSYVVDVDVSFHNPSSEEKKLSGYNLCWGAGIAKDEMISDVEMANEGPVVLVKTETGSQLVKHWRRTGFACFSGKQMRVSDQGGSIAWVGFSSKYFAAVLIPGPEPWWSDLEEQGKRYAVITGSEDNALPPKDVWKKWGLSTTIALIQREFSIPAGGIVSHKFRVYAGPQKWDILRDIKGRDGPARASERLELGKMIDFGTFSPLGKATLWLLELFYRVGNNYGVAIILLTVLVKVLYIPLTQWSFKSMEKMQELQPRIATLREKYRDDPQRLNQETLKLYRRHGTNPMSGCLPLLLQIPVFWALFTTLRGAVELRGAMFIPGWITDLSLPDTVATISRFPIRILPLLMTGTMFIQQFLFGTGTGSQTQSNKMMAMMPVFFMFLFYGMPSGLVLYWTFSNILAIGHQYIIRRQKKAKTEDQGENESENKKGIPPREKGSRNTRKGKNI